MTTPRRKLIEVALPLEAIHREDSSRSRGEHGSERSRERVGLSSLLSAGAWGCRASEIVEAHRSSTAARDDIADAMAVCWAAERVLALSAIRATARAAARLRGYGWRSFGRPRQYRTRIWHIVQVSVERRASRLRAGKRNDSEFLRADRKA